MKGSCTCGQLTLSLHTEQNEVPQNVEVEELDFLTMVLA